MLGQEISDRAERARLAHAPGVQRLRAEDMMQLLDDGAGRGRPADDHAFQLDAAEIEAGGLLDILEEAEPDGRHAEREVAILFRRQIEQALAVEPGAGQHDLGAAHGGCVRDAPAFTWKSGTARSTLSRLERRSPSTEQA